jgi:hypothetical protein
LYLSNSLKGLKLHPFQDSEFICECFPIFGIRKNYRNNGELEKVYDKYPILACSNLVMTTRDPNHYLNIDEFLQGKDKVLIFYSAEIKNLILAISNQQQMCGHIWKNIWTTWTN